MHSVNYENILEPRLNKRGQDLAKVLLRIPSCSIQKISSTRAEQIGYYRFLNNSSVTEEKLLEEQTRRCTLASIGKVILCLSDTTELNFNSHSKRLKPNTGLGFTNNLEKDFGFLAHLSIAIDAKSNFPYGVSDLQLWHRESKQNKQGKAKAKLPIIEKESNKWVKGYTKSKSILKNASHVVYIQDREADVYEQLLNFSASKNEYFIIRCCRNRAAEDSQLIDAKLDAANSIGNYELQLTGEGNAKQGKRKVTMEVRVIKTRIKCPTDKGKSSGLQSLTEEITIIETRQVDVKNGDTPIVWKLLTSCKVNDLGDALQVIEWYTARWIIEELFKIVKKENYDLESSELENGMALRKFFTKLVDSAIKIFQIQIAYNIEEGESLESISSYSKEEFKCLEKVLTTLEGKTDKQKNPHKKKSIKWIIWIFARLGGWKGYASQRKAGITTIIEGMNKFNTIMNGWELYDST